MDYCVCLLSTRLYLTLYTSIQTFMKVTRSAYIWENLNNRHRILPIAACTKTKVRTLDDLGIYQALSQTACIELLFRCVCCSGEMVLLPSLQLQTSFEVQQLIVILQNVYCWLCYRTNVLVPTEIPSSLWQEQQKWTSKCDRLKRGGE